MNLAVAEAEAALAEIGLDLDLSGKAKGPGQGTRFRTQKRDARGHWVEEGFSDSTPKPARKPSNPISSEPAKPAKERPPVTDKTGRNLILGDRVRSPRGNLGTLSDVGREIKVTWDDGGLTRLDAGKRALEHLEKVEGEDALPHVKTASDIALTASTNPAMANGVEKGSSAMEKVHSMPQNLPPLYIHEVKGTALGAYRHSSDISNIDLNAAEGDLDVTLVHEMGHFLDHRGLGSKGFATDDPDSPIQDVLDAALKSRGIKNLPLEWEHNPRYRDYLLEKKEIFARAYTQWVALRSGDLQGFRQGQGQWEDEDFLPIAESIDKLFAERGLLDAN